MVDSAAMDVDAPQASDIAVIDGVPNAVLDEVQHCETVIAHDKEERRLLVTKKYRLSIKRKAALEASDNLLVQQLNLQIKEVEDKMIEYGCGAQQMRRLQSGVDKIIDVVQETRDDMNRQFDEVKDLLREGRDLAIALATGTFEMGAGNCKDQIRINLAATRMIQNRTSQLRESEKAASAAGSSSSSSNAAMGGGHHFFPVFELMNEANPTEKDEELKQTTEEANQTKEDAKQKKEDAKQKRDDAKQQKEVELSQRKETAELKRVGAKQKKDAAELKRGEFKQKREDAQKKKDEAAQTKKRKSSALDDAVDEGVVDDAVDEGVVEEVVDEGVVESVVEEVVEEVVVDEVVEAAPVVDDATPGVPGSPSRALQDSELPRLGDHRE